jgi:hypothetical protein
MQIDYVNTPKQSESWLMAGLTSLMAGLALVAILALMLVASPPVQAEQSATWASMEAAAGTGPNAKVRDYGPGCLVCKAETHSSMTTCGSMEWAKQQDHMWFNSYDFSEDAWCALAAAMQQKGYEVDQKYNVRLNK